MNHQPGIPPKSFRNEELLVFKKCLWYIFCNVNILTMNQIMMPLSKNQIVFHLLPQIYSLMFSTLLSVPGNWPAEIQRKRSCLWFLVGYRHRKNWPETGGREAFIPPFPSPVLHGWRLPRCSHRSCQAAISSQLSLSLRVPVITPSPWSTVSFVHKFPFSLARV